MSTSENPDAAGAHRTPHDPATDAQEIAAPPRPETPAAEAAETALIAPADLTPPAPVAARSAETVVLPDLDPPATPSAPAVLPPAFTGFASEAVPATPPSGPAATAEVPAEAASTVPTAPRTRWAGILWGLALAGIAALALWLLTDADRQAAATEWILHLGPAAAVAYAVLVLGAFALVAGLVGLVRRAQRAGERRRAASSSAL